LRIIKIVFVLTIIMVLTLTATFTTVKGATETPENNAVLTSIKVTNGDGTLKEVINGGSVKLTMGQTPVLLNIEFTNINCSPHYAAGNWFWIKVIGGGQDFLVESASGSSGLSVDVGSNGEISMDLTNVPQFSWFTSIWDKLSFIEKNTGSMDVTVKLYFYGIGNDGTEGNWLEDQKTFTIKATNNFVGLHPKDFSIEQGSSGSLVVNIRNFDTETITDVTVSVIDYGQFLFPQDSQNLNEISADGMKTITFDVNAPNDAYIGTSQITLKATFKDSEGITHSVENNTSLTTIKGKTDFPIANYIAIIAVIIVVLIGILAFILKSKKHIK